MITLKGIMCIGVSEPKPPESPTDRYIQNAEKISRKKGRLLGKALGKKAMCLTSPKTEQDSQEEREKNKILSHCRSHVRKESMKTSGMATIAAYPTHLEIEREVEETEKRRKNPKRQTNGFLTIRLPQLQFASPNQIHKKGNNETAGDHDNSVNKIAAKNPTGENRAKSIAVAKEDIKEILAVTHSIQELSKTIKARAEDIASLLALANKADNTIKNPMQLLEDRNLKIEYRESVRVALESNIIASLVGVFVDEKERKKY